MSSMIKQEGAQSVNAPAVAHLPCCSRHHTADNRVPCTVAHNAQVPARATAAVAMLPYRHAPCAPTRALCPVPVTHRLSASYGAHPPASPCSALSTRRAHTSLVCTPPTAGGLALRPRLLPLLLLRPLPLPLLLLLPRLLDRDRDRLSSKCGCAMRVSGSPGLTDHRLGKDLRKAARARQPASRCGGISSSRMADLEEARKISVSRNLVPEADSVAARVS